ncbi:DUF1016 N-terminal domain-containing protein [Flavobacterium bomense]|uniref:DUF1016 N-terminal domain-containing protein n=1 Tax=Flavobacterium bomense TaxID=2497483 RepID=UPI001F1BCD51|nr:DUF1016 N-terminal domain-containing protein [Flavobacterium bomense]
MTQLLNKDYKNWITEIKSKIRSVQLKAATTVNASLIQFYWELGSMITEKQTAWGTSFLENMSNDLKDEFPEMKGFSVTNLKYCKLFYKQFYFSPQLGDEQDSNSPQLGDENLLPLLIQIPWGHIKLIIDKIKI